MRNCRLTVLLQLALIYLPVLQPIFKTAPLTLGEMTIAVAIAMLAFAAAEIEKVFLRARKRVTITTSATAS